MLSQSAKVDNLRRAKPSRRVLVGLVMVEVDFLTDLQIQVLRRVLVFMALPSLAAAEPSTIDCTLISRSRWVSLIWPGIGSCDALGSAF